MCYCRGRTDTDLRVSTESWPYRRKFSCWDSNLRPFNHKPAAQTTVLSLLPLLWCPMFKMMAADACPSFQNGGGCENPSGSGDSSVTQCWTYDQKVTGPNPGNSSGRIFFSRVSHLFRLLFWYPFHPCAIAVACKRSWSLSQKCRLQLKHTCTLWLWFGIKWL